MPFAVQNIPGPWSEQGEWKSGDAKNVQKRLCFRGFSPVAKVADPSGILVAKDRPT
jgi:hypothetical protein